MQVLLTVSPNFQHQFVTDPPVEVSVNVTVKGAVPVVGVALKLAIGASDEGVATVIRLVLVTELLAPEPCTVRVTE